MALLHEINNGTERFSVDDQGAIKFNNAYQFPVADGSLNYVLKTNGAGTLDWAEDGGGTVKGTGTATRVAFWSANDTISSHADFYWDNTNDRLGIGVGSAPLKKLNVQGTVRIQTNTNYYSDRTYLGDTWEFASDTTDGVTFSITGGLAATAGNYFRWLTQEGAATPIERMRITSAGNVGIGTDSPVNQANYTTLCVNGTNSALIEAQVGTVRIGGIDSSSNALYFGSIGSFPIIFRVAVSEKMRINSQGQTWIGGSSYTGSDIANGNTSYLNSLNAGAFSILHRNSSDAYVHFNTYYTSSSTYVSKYTGIGMMFGVNAAANNGMFFSKAPSVSAGAVQTFETGVMQIGYGVNNNVGIGTTTPSSKLHLRDPGVNSDVGIKIGNDSRDWNLKVMGSVSDSFQIFTHDNSNVMTILPSGNVGIGTTNPSTLLNLEKSVDAFQALLIESTATYPAVSNAAGSKFTNSSGSLYMFVDNGGGDYGPTGGTGAASAYAGNFRLTGAYPLQFATSDTLRMTITAGGDVGIGTTIPGGKLSVGSGLAKTDTSTSNVLYLGQSNDVSNYSTLQVYTKGGATQADRKIIFQTIESGVANAGSIVLQPSGGNVGIGTDSPGTYGPATGTVKLDVLSGDIIRSGFTNPANAWIGFTSLPGYTANSYPSVTSKSSLHFANNDKYCAYLEGADTYFGILNSSSVTKISLNTNGDSYFTGGDVGIGTTSPTYKLEVNSTDVNIALFTTSSTISCNTFFGHSSISNNTNLILYSDAGNVQMWKSGNSSSGWGGTKAFNVYNSDGAIAFHPSGSANAMFINTNSKVGIGTTSPGFLLQVGDTSSDIAMGGNATFNGTSRLKFLGSNSVTNWQISHNDSISGALEFMPSTAAGGSTFTTPAGTLTSAGTFTVTGDLVAYSDKKLKKNIKTLDGSKVYEMRGVSFEKEGKEGSGVIAQEIQEIAPELVSDDGKYLGVAYGNISGYLIEAIKDLKAEIEELKQKPCNCNNCNCK